VGTYVYISMCVHRHIDTDTGTDTDIGADTACIYKLCTGI